MSKLAVIMHKLEPDLTTEEGNERRWTGRCKGCGAEGWGLALALVSKQIPHPRASAAPNTVQLRRKGEKEDNEAVRLAYLSQTTVQERTCLMRLTIPENRCDDKVCQQIDYSTDEESSHSPFPQARLLLLV